MDNLTTTAAGINASDGGDLPATSEVPSLYDFGESDAVFMMICAFVLVTLQTGFVLLESGCVAPKNQISMMLRNVVDIVLGGVSFWLFGYAFMLGRSGELRNPVIGLGDFAVDAEIGNPLMGQVMVIYLFQMTFSACCTTIVGGAVAERFNLKAYCAYSFLNTIVYAIAAGWVWGEHGFLARLGVVDIAGGGPVHLVGGASALAAAILIGPRLGRYDKGTEAPPLGNPVNVCLSLFVLWWGWLGFNSGSIYGITDGKWVYAARAAVTTLMGSFGGGTFGVIYSMARTKGRLDLVDLINAILGAMVAVTPGCSLYHAWEALLIGVIGAGLCVVSVPLLDKLRVDDPVGAVAVHGVGGIWGILAVGLFAYNPDATGGRAGLLKGGDWSLLGVQALSIVCLASWAICATFALLWLINKVLPIRMTPDDELLGADWAEHNINYSQLEISRALSVLAPLKTAADHQETAMKSPSTNGFSGPASPEESRMANQLYGYDNQVFVMSTSGENNRPRKNIS